MQEAERRMDFTDSLKISEDSRTSSQQSSRPAREEKQRVLLLSGKTTPQLSLSLSFIQLLSALVCLSRNEPHIPIYTILNVSLSPAACRYIELLYI
jgi:hypothetical protein